ncbi:MAG TPA: class I SAM-dependent methyltransferase [Polyangia bacterium]
MRYGVAIALVSLCAGGCSRRARADVDRQAAHEPARVDAEAAQYERYRAPSTILTGLALAPGQRVADVGAGRGFLTTRLAAAVGAAGHVVATDIDAAALAAIPRAANVETRLVHADDPGLEAGAYDRILVAEVDHYLADRTDYLRRLGRALRPGGFIAVENRLPYRAPLVAAAAAAGLRVSEIAPAPPIHFFVKLEPAR